MGCPPELMSHTGPLRTCAGAIRMSACDNGADVATRFSRRPLMPVTRHAAKDLLKLTIEPFWLWR
jgi:hypothetical protein